VLQALAARDQQPVASPGPFGERLHQRGLADAGLTGHEDHLAPAGGGQLEQGGESLKLGLAADRGGQGGRAGRALAALLDRCQEPVAATVERADHPLLPTAVADRPAGGLQPARQRRLGHEPAAPDLVEQLVLGDHPVPVADEVAQHLEDLRLQVAGPAAPAQLVAEEIELAVSKPVDHPARLPISSTPSPRLPGASWLA
jgi:hypothetical protein